MNHPRFTTGMSAAARDMCRHNARPIRLKKNQLTTESTEIRFYRASGEYGYLSNLYKAPVMFEGREFATSESAYQFGKPKDKRVAEWIISAPKPHLCAAAAHSLLAFDIVPGWNDIKVDRMRRVLRAKFTQHEELREKLLGTGEARLIEESNTDAFWGIGKHGTGKNYLGILLMGIRDELRTGRTTGGKV